MGKFEKGILGGFQGKVGTVIGSTWKGIDYMKSRSRKSKKPASPAQLEQQARFALLVKFVSSFGRLLMLGFKDSANGMTGINRAFAYNYDHAITGSYPGFAIDYSKVLLTKGQLHNGGSPASSASGNGQVKLTWTDNSGMAMANATDKCIIAIHCPELNQSVYTTDGSVRSSGSAVIDAGNFTGKTVETWVSFISGDGTEVATSIYTGQVTVS